MSKIICFALLVLVTCTPTSGQIKEDAPRLLGSFGAKDDDVLNAIFLLGEHVSAISFNPKEDSLAIRVCSNDPLLVALTMAKSAPFLTTLKLENRGIPKSRIFYLRDNRSCRPLLNDYASTDFWLVPKNAEFPQFLETRRASNLLGVELTHAGYLSKAEPVEVRSYELEKLTPQSYQLAVDELVKSLKRSKDAVAVIHVPYYKRTSTIELNRRVSETVKYLHVNRISKHRIYVRRIYSGISVPPFVDEPKYPDIFVIGEN